eukprot:scaffold178848_cov32-Tisochrysis_lutea.AAC.2
MVSSETRLCGAATRIFLSRSLVSVLTCGWDTCAETRVARLIDAPNGNYAVCTRQSWATAGVRQGPRRPGMWAIVQVRSAIDPAQWCVGKHRIHARTQAPDVGTKRPDRSGRHFGGRIVHCSKESIPGVDDA